MCIHCRFKCSNAVLFFVFLFYSLLHDYLAFGSSLPVSCLYVRFPHLLLILTSGEVAVKLKSSSEPRCLTKLIGVLSKYVFWILS